MFEKNSKILFNEINQKNTNNKINLNLSYVKLIFDEIKKECKTIKILENDNNFFIKKIKEIKSKNYNIKVKYSKLISIIIKACKKVFDYEPRDIQIISLLFFLLKETDKGLIEQINTGEGKSIIIAFLAIIKAIEGKKVDILTSSCVLAERDALKMKKLYDLFGLSVGYCKINNDIELSENKLKYFKCYDADIVYGDTLSFEGDILRTNFMGITGRGTKRPFDCIIIDEIDNICLDNIKNITELLDNFHGYKFLEYIYLYIYDKLNEIDNEIKNNFSDNDEYLLDIAKNKNKIIEKLLKYSENELLDFKKLKDKNIIIPEHLENYIKLRLIKWCEAAYDAKYIYKENKEYIISYDEEYGFKTIKPVDFSNTGVIQQNSIWTGLHQFLQIKENLRLTEENINSCYMSNLSFFKKYITKNENNIFGLTGTLGTLKSQKALEILYNLNLLFMPSFKESNFKLEKPIIINDINEYKEKLFYEIKKIAIEDQRAVLVILRYIEEVNSMYEFLLNKNIPKENLIKYSRNDLINETNFLNDEIQTGTIILSTNLSGRGTDIKISKILERKKGLHVILTFMPISERIEMQAFGRAARKGEKGSGNYILNSDKNYEILIKERNEMEENEFKYLINIYKKKIDLFQEIFEEFTDLLNKIKKSKKVDEIVLLDIKETWALFLVENDLTNIEKVYKDETVYNSTKIYLIM